VIFVHRVGEYFFSHMFCRGVGEKKKKQKKAGGEKERKKRKSFQIFVLLQGISNLSSSSSSSKLSFPFFENAPLFLSSPCSPR